MTIFRLVLVLERHIARLCNWRHQRLLDSPGEMRIRVKTAISKSVLPRNTLKVNIVLLCLIRNGTNCSEKVQWIIIACTSFNKDLVISHKKQILYTHKRIFVMDRKQWQTSAWCLNFLSPFFCGWLKLMDIKVQLKYQSLEYNNCYCDRNVEIWDQQLCIRVGDDFIHG